MTGSKPLPILLPWLSWKEKVISAALIVSSIVIAFCTLFLVYLRGPVSPLGQDEHYPDLITEEGTACWEANVFASKYDPLYEWVRSASMAAAYKNVAVERMSLAYQRASVWRVSGELVKSSENVSCTVTRYYNSPDPRLLGGVIHHDRSWVYKMTIYWGMSIRLCLHVDPTHVDNTCTKTTPIMWTGPNSFAALMAEIPFGRASAEMFRDGEEPYVSFGSYLSNFACSGRQSPCLRINKRRHRQQGHYWKYISKIKECRKASPIQYAADVVSYLAFPSLQCACMKHPKVCIIGFNMTSEENFRLKLKLNTTYCETSKTFWHLLDTPGADEPGGHEVHVTRFIFSKYIPRWNHSLSLNVSFNCSRLELGRSMQWKPLVKLNSCVDRWLGRHTMRPVNGWGILKTCAEKGVVSVSPVESATGARSIFSRYQIIHYKSEIVDNIVPVTMRTGPYCGISRGQVDRDFCALHLDEIYTQYQVGILLESIGYFARVADIREFSKREWKKGSSRRSEVSIEIITTMLAFAITVTGMLSRKMQDAEDLLVNSAQGFRTLINRTIGMAMLRTLIRSSVIAITTGWSIFEFYKSLEEMEAKVPQLATSGTILQQANGMSFLVTTTSNIQVCPKWLAFYVICNCMGVVLVIVIVYVYSLMVYIQREEERAAAV